MAFGQGARASLPIYGKMMRKIYNNREIGILETDTFAIPANYSPCNNELYTLPSAEDVINGTPTNYPEADEEFF